MGKYTQLFYYQLDFIQRISIYLQTTSQLLFSFITSSLFNILLTKMSLLLIHTQSPNCRSQTDSFVQYCMAQFCIQKCSYQLCAWEFISPTIHVFIWTFSKILLPPWLYAASRDQSQVWVIAWYPVAQEWDTPFKTLIYLLENTLSDVCLKCFYSLHIFLKCLLFKIFHVKSSQPVALENFKSFGRYFQIKQLKEQPDQNCNLQTLPACTEYWVAKIVIYLPYQAVQGSS